MTSQYGKTNDHFQLYVNESCASEEDAMKEVENEIGIKPSMVKDYYECDDFMKHIEQVCKNACEKRAGKRVPMPPNYFEQFLGGFN